MGIVGGQLTANLRPARGGGGGGGATSRRAWRVCGSRAVDGRRMHGGLVVDARRGTKRVAVLVDGIGGCVIAARVAVMVGLLPRPPTSNHSRESSLLSFSNDG